MPGFILRIIQKLMTNNNFIQLQFSKTTDDQNDQLIALLSDIGFSGFEENEHNLKAFIKEENFTEEELKAVLEIVPCAFESSVIVEENWNAQWESSFQPIIIHNFASIRADFHAPITQVKHEIIITPKMSFGTGHHATTYQMIEQMEHIDFNNKRVIDFGTGTGVLAILAEKSGAKEIVAIDNDDWSISNAHENIITNNCSRIKILKADTIPSTENAEVILANINLNIIIENLQEIKNAAAPGAIILFSGIMEHDASKILSALETVNIKVQTVFQKNGWLALWANS